MAREFLNGIKPAVVTVLPSAASSANVMLCQGGKIWFSDGTTWKDLTATGGAGGSQEVFVQQTRPVEAGPWTWWQTDALGNVINLTLNDGA